MHGGSTIPGGSTPSSVVDLDDFCYFFKGNPGWIFFSGLGSKTADRTVEGKAWKHPERL